MHFQILGLCDSLGLLARIGGEVGPTLLDTVTTGPRWRNPKTPATFYTDWPSRVAEVYR